MAIGLASARASGEMDKVEEHCRSGGGKGGFQGASGIVSFDKYGERDSVGLTYVLENAQAPAPVAGADEEQFLLGEYWVTLGTYEDRRGLERAKGVTPYWPGGLRSWKAPPDRVNIPEPTPVVVVQEVLVESPTSHAVVIVVSGAAVVLLLLLVLTQP
jgi:hypothetical protein